MRQVKETVTASGETRYRVRYRQGTTETSETFRREADATTFAAILGTGKADNVTEALAWLASKESTAQTQSFGTFFESYVEQLTGVTARTRDDYRAMRRRYLSSLDQTPITLITRAQVAAIVNKLDAEEKSPKTIKNVIHMLSSVMALAVDEGHVARNPVKRVRLPKARLGETEPKFLTHDEFRALVGATPDHYKPLIVFLVGTGLRWSEVTALQSRHVDIANGTVRVERAWKRVPGGWELGPPKSAKSKRTVNAATLALAAASPLLGKPNDLVFTTPRGNVIRHANFYNRIWVPACKKARLDPRPSPHDLRHSHASWLLSDGIPIEAVQDQLGHESLETTRRVYAHLLPAVGVAAGRAASAALARALPHGMQVGAAPVELSAVVSA